MIIKDLEKYKNIYDKVDALIIVNKDNVIVYSAMINDDRTHIATKDVIGKDLYEMYPNLTWENSTHGRVMRSGKPVINENQLIVEKTGKAYVISTSTFPIEYNGEIIGSFDISSNLTPKKGKSDKDEEKNRLYTIDSIITQNEEMIELKEKILKVAKNDSPVMVTGESGTGKELIVEAIHKASRRHDKPFISLNCAAIPDSLMESTLFGTVKGSFTGAENKKGVFELADGGTLFLDEINSMNIELQAKLLKVVEEQRYMKIGGEKYVGVDVRLISAMNSDPYEVIRNNAMRQDLFYRLSVVMFRVPALRKRKEDIPLLTEHFVDYYNKKMNKSVKGVDESVKAAFDHYSWPGNVRELKNTLEAAFNMIDGGLITTKDLPDHVNFYAYEPAGNDKRLGDGGLSQVVGAFEKEILIETLKETKTLSEAAVKLKITRQALKYKIEKYQIDYKTLQTTAE